MVVALASGRRDLYDLIQRHAKAKEVKAARMQKEKATQDAKKAAVLISLEDREKEAEKALEAATSSSGFAGFNHFENDLVITSPISDCPWGIGTLTLEASARGP